MPESNEDTLTNGTPSSKPSSTPNNTPSSTPSSAPNSKTSKTPKSKTSNKARPSIAKSLSQKTIAITGATGFLGTALVERLLRTVPDCQLLLLVRPGKRGAKRRIEIEVLNNDAFNPLRKKLGTEAFKALADERITPIAADITQENLGLNAADSQLLTSTDIFIHSAASVSFTSPLDLAIETNLIGPIRILNTLDSLKIQPHLIAVSTAYVAGNHKGYVTESPLAQSAYDFDIDIEGEIQSARRARATIEDQSRTTKMLDQFDKEAKEYLGAPGTAALSKRREQLRRSWVKESLVNMGQQRAASLGFADIYGLTKAMAETAMCQRRKDIPLTLVRPSIIESALAEPYQGWIRGFRMAEPIIISYARGLLKDFPAKPEGVLDVIPVDMVTAALCAVAASPTPAPDATPQVFNVASGSVNPFLFRDLHDWCHNWFTQNPVYDEHNKPIYPPRWSYPSRTRVNKQLNRAKRALTLGESIIRKLPIRGKPAQSAAILEERRAYLEKAIGYVNLYGMYLECEAIFGTENLLQLYNSLDPKDKESFVFDPQVIDWFDYVTRIHLPSVLIQGRIKTQPTPKQTSKNGKTILRGRERLHQAILSPDRQLAVFDLENTLIASNVVASWGWLATRNLSKAERIKFVARTLLESPKLLSLDRSNRSDFLQYFYKRFAGAEKAQIEKDSQEMFSDLLLQRCFPAAIRRVREHKAIGHRTLLITGALDFVVEPLAPLFDDIICAELQQHQGHYTGRLKGNTPIGELRANILRDYAEERNISTQDTVVYADSVSDIPLLEAVGFPVAVNPEVKLAGIANRRGWLIENFQKPKGHSHKILPIGPPRSIPTNAIPTNAPA